MSSAGEPPLSTHTHAHTHHTKQPEGCNSSPESLIIAAALMTQWGSRCCMEMKEEMQRIYNASKITDKAQRKQNFAWGSHHQGVGI